MSPRLNRRQFMIGAGLAAAGLAGGCRPGDPAGRLWPAPGSRPAETPEPAWRVLNRITLGPRPEERQRAAEIGLAAFIEEQLAPESLPEPDLGPRLAIRRLETLALAAPDLFDVPEEVVTRQLQQASLLRAIYSSRQLYEGMVDFWSNHFNIAQTKGECAWLKTVDDREVIRPHALGNFRELLHASAHSPAMLVYLDNRDNAAGKPNENYARELLELHTLGVNGGYNQQDVQELARCLTGWTVKEHFYRGQFIFKPELHDDGLRHILGLALPAGTGQAGGEQVLDMLAGHPATARFIARKLTRRFVADEPPAGLVNQAAQVFSRTGGNIKAVLRTILLSPELLSPGPAEAGSLSGSRAKLKRPLEFMAGALRQLNARTDAGPALLAHLAAMGQPLFQWPTPDGYPDLAEAWSHNLLGRWRFALALTRGQIPGTTLDLPAGTDPAGRLEELARRLLGRPLPPPAAGRLLQASPPLSDEMMVAVLVSSPAFQWRH